MTLPVIDETHDPNLLSWVDSANGHEFFPVQNLPFGIFDTGDGVRRPGVAIGDSILDLAGISALLPEAVVPALSCVTLNALFALPADDRTVLRRRLSTLLSDRTHRSALTPMLHDAGTSTLHLPATIGDYTDFYVGIHHAANVGTLFRPDSPLLPNYKYVPIGYHGRASSIRPSGTAVIRPVGQRKAPDEAVPVFGPTERLDYELELGVWIGPGNDLGTAIPIADAHRHIMGLCLLNDWSARDFQTWEYVPLGPFLAKNFHSTISPWVVTAQALAPFRIAQSPRPDNDPAPLPYLWDEVDQARGAFAIDLEVSISSETMRAREITPMRLSRGEASHMYWTVAQIVTHHASNGCNLNPGDLLGTGTISAPDRGGMGSLLEITGGGKEHVKLPTGELRGFLEDGDELTMSAVARAQGFVSIGFGVCRAMIQPAPAQ